MKKTPHKAIVTQNKNVKKLKIRAKFEDVIRVAVKGNPKPQNKDIKK